MLNSKILFGNLFRSHKITAERLLVFGRAVLSSLVADNSNGQFTAIIALLTAALKALQDEVAAVDGNFNGQKSNTKLVDAFIKDFARYMSDKEPFIAEALHGNDTLAYAALYPHQPGEYWKATKTSMPVLTARVNTAATKYAAQLGTTITARLQGFSTQYKETVKRQQSMIGNVLKARSDRSVALKQAQQVLTTAVFTVAAQYPCNIAKCSTFFPFALLYSQRRRSRYTVAGTLAHTEAKELLNRSINKTTVITIVNTGSNSTLCVWLALSPAGAMPGTAIEIAANSSKNIQAAELGNLENTFFMVKNTSSINDGAYEVTFIGLPKKATVKKDKKQRKIKVIRNDAA